VTRSLWHSRRPGTERDLHALRGCCQVRLKAQLQAPLRTRHTHTRLACAHQHALRPRRRARVGSSGLVGAGGRGSASAKACEAERCFTSADGCAASKCSADTDGSRPEQDASQLMFMVAADLHCNVERELRAGVQRLQPASVSIACSTPRTSSHTRHLPPVRLWYLAAAPSALGCRFTCRRRVGLARHTRV
jgi:hypothetical protein